ncbi:protocadherin Fat 4-like [Physella acuta]|uniref:protocadherin Fat 4-like n=1 Tax=Physella acuta TaxID=109671 RepID=UPI0027DD5A94|nr:protocadherin Fat 4-like [Physella acuta]
MKVSLAPFNVVRYEIVRQSVPNIFAINSIAVRAYDGGNPALSSYNVFRVTVNGNLQSPVFVVPGSAANYIASVEILEHIGFNYDIHTVTVTDGDLGDAGKVSYYLVGDNQALMYYQVITDSGIIRIRSSLLQDNVQQYTLNIIARDGDISNPKVSTTTATVSVSVYRNKFSPQFINMAAYNQVIDANLQVGQRVTAVTATDADRVNTYERVDYQIIGDGDSFGLFQINSNTGEITLKSSLANYGASVYYVRVQANDNGVVPHKFSNTTVLTITVNQNLRTPVWNVVDQNNPAFTFTISEDQYLYFPFGFLSATDGDSQPPHNLVDFYYSPASQSALEFFRVTRDGEMSAIKSLVGATSNSYTWTMGLSDRGTPIRNNSRLATVTVLITRNNNAPYFTNCPPATATVVREDAALGTTVLRVTASDNDPPSSRFGNITVSLIGDGTSNVFFRLNSNNEIVVDGNLASTSTSSYQILVQVSDQGSPPKQAQCVIPVSINHNLQAPVFGNTSYSVRILENLPPASSVIRVIATDADIYAPNNVIDYIITSGGEYFQVDQSTGLISVKVPVYLDTATSYQVTLIARDRGTPTRQSAPFNVTITPQRNRFAPKWQATPCNFYLTLPLTNNQLLRTLTATDDDLPPFNKLEFDLLPYSNTQPLFTAEINNQNSVNIRVPNAKLINFDTLPQYFFYARVHDNGTPRLSDIAVVILNVHQNSNDSSFPTTTKTDTADEDSTLSMGAKD